MEVQVQLLHAPAQGGLGTPGGMLKKTVYLDPEEWAALKKRSYEEDRPVSDLVRELIRAGLGLDG